MKKMADLSSPEIRKLGLQALKSQLGIARSLKFLLEYSKGEGDYTQTRKNVFRKQKVNEIVEDMKREGFI